MRRFLEVTDLEMTKHIVELVFDKRDMYEGKPYCSWGITAIGCTFQTIDGEFMMIHPKSIMKMRQWLQEEA